MFAFAPTSSGVGIIRLEPEDDDYLHDPRCREKQPFAMSSRGILNVATLLALSLAMLMLFAGYPLLSGLGILNKNNFAVGTNGTGQIPDLPLLQLIDTATPSTAMKWSSPDKIKYDLVFSDEFQVNGRTFWPGDDPFWEAVDIWYGATGDYEWYSPDNIVTQNGSLVITFEAKESHNLNFQSGMLQSWNKTCFQGGYIEFSIQLPGTPQQQGFWPGAWIMGNLARPGYLGSTDGMWPYSYSACDTGILANQTNIDGTGPDGAIHSKGTYADNRGHISHLPGMRASSCTCPGEDHPGPNRKTARSAPEFDILEASVVPRGAPTKGQASQSLQIAPFDEGYHWLKGNASAPIYGSTTDYNTYEGSVYQEAVSAVSDIPLDGYVSQGQRFVTYALEYEPDWDLNGGGYVRWFVDGQPTWMATGAAVGPSSAMDISQRHISPEPMAMVINLAMAHNFEPSIWDSLVFPNRMLVDYVRVYQRSGRATKLSCDPPDYPTAEYINSHLQLYMNPNLTQYTDVYPWVKNSLTNPGC
ncbi:glycoside hydrolase family 16 protein [Tilletiaria anomala UBC 951]|uniref:Glycoside hydrolase family 16 protein n=1 Tax=Tilletiaria anomala (strain ATCC 24038 / CBS 436.72 / UBC 951) TaxID=1037660 RepID=A0A066W911_TILAU|nr:glycoside hydrolase family 16 protein [Tilletiaria anomala UBC 951]KDN47569.1 glycoside hydrolase family 16 protein [Tilletiaria anomala UBC 951]